MSENFSSTKKYKNLSVLIDKKGAHHVISNADSAFGVQRDREGFIHITTETMTYTDRVVQYDFLPCKLKLS